MSYTDTQLLIDNRWAVPSAGHYGGVVNPATGLEIGRSAHAQAKELNWALDAARAGFQTWRRTPAMERAALMRRAAALLRERTDQTANLMTMEQGKPLAESKAELRAGADIID